MLGLMAARSQSLSKCRELGRDKPMLFLELHVFF